MSWRDSPDFDDRPSWREMADEDAADKGRALCTCGGFPHCDDSCDFREYVESLDPCRCSDPGCPCTGYKRGIP